jgi:hypothetical protein
MNVQHNSHQDPNDIHDHILFDLFMDVSNDLE